MSLFKGGQAAVVAFSLVGACGPSSVPAAAPHMAPAPIVATAPLVREPAPTVIDLSDNWVPFPFSEDLVLGDKGSSYRATFVALANDAFGAGRRWDRARDDGAFELYGIFPSLVVVRRRLLDVPRHECHDLVDDMILATDVILARKSRSVGAIVAAQRHLVCEGYLRKRDVRGKLGSRTVDALSRYQRGHMLLATGRLDDATAMTLLADSRELDFRTLLRVLRERVTDAAGLIEDGSALGAWGTVLGRDLEALEFRSTQGWVALDGGAPDAISPATEAAARALGWTGPSEAAAWFRARPTGATARLTISVELPPPPPYHAAIRSLRVEIDRGDVHLRDNDRPSVIRPFLILYAVTDAGDVPLIRWPTTIGSWEWQQTRTGRRVRRYKESPVGAGVWRNLVVAPVWLPPSTTPKRELVHRVGGRWALREQTIGPGYASAYGLLMFMHEGVSQERGADVFSDEGIRTHGSVNVASIMRDSSHGCHRLFNNVAVRLGQFVLRHTPHVRRGPMLVDYELRVPWKKKILSLHRDDRGYLWELTPPVPVNVLPGRVVR